MWLTFKFFKWWGMLLYCAELFRCQIQLFDTFAFTTVKNLASFYIWHRLLKLSLFKRRFRFLFLLLYTCFGIIVIALTSF